jgi:hypothetical protein
MEEKLDHKKLFFLSAGSVLDMGGEKMDGL